MSVVLTGGTQTWQLYWRDVGIWLTGFICPDTLLSVWPLSCCHQRARRSHVQVMFLCLLSPPLPPPPQVSLTKPKVGSALEHFMTQFCAGSFWMTWFSVHASLQAPQRNCTNPYSFLSSTASCRCCWLHCWIEARPHHYRKWRTKPTRGFITAP